MWLGNPGCPSPCCPRRQAPCREIAGRDLLLTAPSGAHTLHAVAGPENVWACCFRFTAPHTRDNVLAGCPSVASGEARIEYRLGNCPPYRSREDSTRGLLFAIATALNPCDASHDGFVHARTSNCSGDFLTAPNYGFTFLDVDYAPEYPFGASAISIDFTNDPFSMSFTLPATDHNGYPVPFPGDYVISLSAEG